MCLFKGIRGQKNILHKMYLVQFLRERREKGRQSSFCSPPFWEDLVTKTT